MQCFSFTEQAVPFLRGVIDEDGDPVIPTPEGCAMPLVVGKEWTERLAKAARTYPERFGYSVRSFGLGYTRSRSSEYARRTGVELDMAMDTLVLKPPRYQRRAEEQALVRLETAGGVGGKVRLTSCLYEEEMKDARVVEHYSSFPSMGVQPLCTDEMLKRVNDGVEVLDLFVLMNPGSRFRIQRSGGLEKAKRYITVAWTGSVLRPMSPYYEDRGAVGVFAAA